MELLAFGIMRDIHCHADAEDLESYSMGASSVEETARIEEHLLICEDCRDRLQQGEGFLNSMQVAARQWRRDEKALKRRGWKIPAWLPVLAAACALVLVVVAVRAVRSTGPAVAVSLTALRGNGAGSIGPARRELSLQPDLTGLADVPAYRLEIVDQTGRSVRLAALPRTQGAVAVPGLAAGQYFVRLYLPAGNLLREYGLEIR
jgi:hypothetical protein